MPLNTRLKDRVAGNSHTTAAVRACLYIHVHVHDNIIHVHDNIIHVHDNIIHVHGNIIHVHDNIIHVHDNIIHVHDNIIHVHVPKELLQSLLLCLHVWWVGSTE